MSFFKNTKSKVLGSLILVLGLALIIGFQLYNKPHVNINKAGADLAIRADELAEEYQMDEAKANQKYVDRILEVEGKITKVTFDNGNSIVTLGGEDGKPGIICQMLPEDNLKVLKYKERSSVKIKGICTGHLIDVMMIRCVFVD